MVHSVDVVWGLSGARSLSESCDVLALVDVLSFSTSLTIAVARGAEVWPAAWGTDGAEHLAREIGATLARGRSTRQGATLSPASLVAFGFEPGSRLVLPSPNGSGIAHAAVGSDQPVLGACLRNVSAAADALRSYERVGVVAAGERWPDGSLRPAYEDWLGAGLLVAALSGPGVALTPDAEAAAAASRVRRPLAQCPSGAELIGRDFAEDVALADELDVETVVPVLSSGRFVALV